MSITKRVWKHETTWLARVFISQDPVTGKQKIKSKAFKKLGDAKLWEAKTIQEVASGQYQVDPKEEAPRAQTFEEFFSEWIEKSAKVKLKTQTIELYERLFRLYVGPQLGQLPLQEVTAQRLQGLYADLQTGERPLSPQTIKNVHTALRSALKQALRWRLIPHNPCPDVDLPRRQRHSTNVRSLDPEQAGRFLVACRAHRQGLVLIFALATGARPGEYLALLWSDIDWKAGTVRFERSIIWPKGGGWHFDDPKTGRSARTITIPPEVLEALRQHRHEQLQTRLLLGKHWKSDHDFVFTDSLGGPIYERHLTTRVFDQVLSAAGLSKRDILRELAAERLLRSKAVATVQAAEMALPESSAVELLGEVLRLENGFRKRETGKVRAAVKQALKTVSIPDKEAKRLAGARWIPYQFVLYDLRHSVATLLLLSKVPAKVVSERLGHAGVTITLDTYSHVLPAQEQEASEGLRAILFPRGSKEVS